MSPGIRRDDESLSACAASASQHSQRLHIGFENGLLLGALVGVLLAQTHDRAQRLDVEAVALGLGVDVADIVGDDLLLLLQPLDALDAGLELIFCECCRRLFLDGSGRGGHRVLLKELTGESERASAALGRTPILKMNLEKTLKSAAPCVKATSRSSTVHPQEKASVVG